MKQYSSDRARVFEDRLDCGQAVPPLGWASRHKTRSLMSNRWAVVQGAASLPKSSPSPSWRGRLAQVWEGASPDAAGDLLTLRYKGSFTASPSAVQRRRVAAGLSAKCSG